MMRHFILCVQLLFGMRGAMAALCPDGSAGLTKALYEAGRAAAYQDVTCIPDGEFKEYGGEDVTLSGLPSLKSIGREAFADFVGTLTITGEYPALEAIDRTAFWRVNSNSVVTFNGLPSLKSIGQNAFNSFDGKLTFTGEYPALETINSNAFYGVSNVDSTITLTVLPSLKSIGGQAFWNFHGKLIITGEYPALETINSNAFYGVSNVDSTITLTVLPSLKSIGYRAFSEFGGKLSVTGEYPALVTIDREAFWKAGSADSTIAFSGLKSLKSIGYRAFFARSGKLTFTGEYPALETIGESAFASEHVSPGNTASVVHFTGLPSLKGINKYAFGQFGGKLTFTGEYPALETIDKHAFGFAGNADSDITLTGLSFLKSIGERAFYAFGGKLTVTGEYPALETIDGFAFESSGNANSVVAIACSSPAGLTIAESAFTSFTGTRHRTNEFTQCNVTTTTTTATATTITTTSRTSTVAAATFCPDGSAGLTQALYEAGDPAAYQDVTCIPDAVFKYYRGDVTLNGLPSLKSIGEEAFHSFGGKLAITGEYPALEAINLRAFFDSNDAGNVDSAIAFNGLPSLKSIGQNAFYSFGGKITFTGEYPALETIDFSAFQRADNVGSIITLAELPSLKSIKNSAFCDFDGKLTITGEYPTLEIIDLYAFRYHGNANSIVAFNGLQSLKSIGEDAFYDFKGKLTFTGAYPALETIGPEAFHSAGNAESVVAIACSSLAGLAIGTDAFDLFKGTHNAVNELKQCAAVTSATTTTTTLEQCMCADPDTTECKGAAFVSNGCEGDGKACCQATACPNSETFTQKEVTGAVTCDSLPNVCRYHHKSNFSCSEFCEVASMECHSVESNFYSKFPAWGCMRSRTLNSGCTTKPAPTEVGNFICLCKSPFETTPMVIQDVKKTTPNTTPITTVSTAVPATTVATVAANTSDGTRKVVANTTGGSTSAPSVNDDNQLSDNDEGGSSDERVGGAKNATNSDGDDGGGGGGGDGDGGGGGGSNGDEPSKSSGGGATGGAVAAAVAVLAIVIVVWMKRRHAASNADLQQNRGETIEMMDNPMQKAQQAPAPAAVNPRVDHQQQQPDYLEPATVGADYEYGGIQQQPDYLEPATVGADYEYGGMAPEAGPIYSVYGGAEGAAANGTDGDGASMYVAPNATKPPMSAREEVCVEPTPDQPKIYGDQKLAMAKNARDYVAPSSNAREILYSVPMGAPTESEFASPDYVPLSKQSHSLQQQHVAVYSIPAGDSIGTENDTGSALYAADVEGYLTVGGANSVYSAAQDGGHDYAAVLVQHQQGHDYAAVTAPSPDGGHDYAASAEVSAHGSAYQVYSVPFAAGEGSMQSASVAAESTQLLYSMPSPSTLPDQTNALNDAGMIGAALYSSEQGADA